MGFSLWVTMVRHHILHKGAHISFVKVWRERGKKDKKRESCEHSCRENVITRRVREKSCLKCKLKREVVTEGSDTMIGCLTTKGRGEAEVLIKQLERS